MAKKVDLMQGTLEILILKAVSLGALHGYGILLRIQLISQGRLDIPQGSFYIALYRMEHKGLIQGEWGESENNRRAKFYTLTASGRKQLKAETEKWAQMTDVVDTILGTTPEEA
jgi:transcriptional regulator